MLALHTNYFEEVPSGQLAQKYFLHGLLLFLLSQKSFRPPNASEFNCVLDLKSCRLHSVFLSLFGYLPNPIQVKVVCLLLALGTSH